MTISNVVLDRDKRLVTFDTANNSDIEMPVIWTEGYGWILDRYCEYEKAINKILKGALLDGLSLENLSMRIESMPDQDPTPDYYNKTYKGGKIDFYRIAKAYGITDPCHQHALKKFLRATNKGDITTDLELIEVIEGILARWKEMIKEDAE